MVSAGVTGAATCVPAKGDTVLRLDAACEEESPK